MRFYATRRRWIFAVAACLALGVYTLFACLRWDSPFEYGYWLRQLFVMLGYEKGDLGVEIVAFDKTFDPRSYDPEVVRKSPELTMLAETPGVRYDRAIYAATLERLIAAGARAVVFDIVFEGPGPTEAGDRALAEALERHRDKTVIGFAYTVSEVPRADGRTAEHFVSVRDPYDAFLAPENPERSLGYVNFWPEFNGEISRMVGRQDPVSLARPELAAKLTTFSDMSLAARTAAMSGATIPDDCSSRLINFAGPRRTFAATPVHRLFTPDGDLSRFKDKIVLVGPYSELHYKLDWFTTPLGAMFGVEVQANCVRDWLRGSWIREPFAGPRALIPGAAACLMTFLAGGLFAGLRGGRRVAALSCVPPLYAFGAYGAFAFAGVFLPLMPALLSASLGLTFGALDFVHAQYERRRIKGLFGSYLPPVVVDRLVASGSEPELGGEQVALTAFFADIRHFSTFAEKLAPGELVTLMNEYLGAMTVLLEEESGTLDKYVGDGIVAMFGAPVALPGHAYRACVCALRMQDRLAGLRAEWTAEGGFLAMAGHDLRMRIGLNTGVAVVGNMGSGKRFNYTMMGDAVNLAARCEAYARNWGIFTLATEDTVVAARASGGRPILFRLLGHRRVKGRSEIVAMYEVVGFADEASPERLECVRLYEAALAALARPDLPEAVRLFTLAEPLERHMPAYETDSGESPSRIMLRRCADGETGFGED